MAARDWLDLVRRAAAEIEPLQRELSGLMAARDECVTWRTASGGVAFGAGGYSDPTSTQAMGRIGELESRIGDVQERLRQCVSLVGECGEVLMRMERALGRRHREVIEIYYIDRAGTWSEVADEIGVTYRHMQRLRDAAYEWIDEHENA